MMLSDVCLSVWRQSVAYIGPKSRTERPRKTKIGTEVAHVTPDADTTFKVRRSKVKVTGGGDTCTKSHSKTNCELRRCVIEKSAKWTSLNLSKRWSLSTVKNVCRRVVSYFCITVLQFYLSAGYFLNRALFCHSCIGMWLEIGNMDDKNLHNRWKKKLLELKVVDISSNYICSGLKVGLQSRAVGEIYTFTKNTGR